MRELLIKRGQEIREEMCDPGFFARSVASKFSSCSNYIVITDWRLPCEYDVVVEACRQAGLRLLTVRVNRIDLLTSPVEDTTTEHQLDNWPFDIQIMNTGTNLGDLEFEVMKQIATRVE